MGLLEKIFKPREIKQADVVTSYFRTLSAYAPVFTSWDGGLYEMELTRAAVHAFASQCSKLKPEVQGAANSRIQAAISSRPNPYMDISRFIYRVATILAVENTVFIVPLLEDADSTIVGYWPLLPQGVEVFDWNAETWLRYTFRDGSKAAIEYSRVGVLTNMQYKDDFFGSNNRPLSPTLTLLDVQRQGMEEAIKSAAAIRFMAKLGQTLRPEDIKRERERFAADNLSAENTSGVMMFDAKYADVQQIDSHPWLIDDKQMALIKANVFDYFGVNEKILQNDYDENTWNAFYEGKVEPFALQLGLALTNMTFTDREQSFGNKIMFSSSRLQYASNATKVQVVTQLVDRGLMSNWQAAEVFNLPQPPGPERWVIRGEYIDMQNLPANTIDNAKAALAVGGGD
jgi:hypothetical protein